MADWQSVDSLRRQLHAGLEETFTHVHGIYLDRGTSLFETLATISADEASRPVSATCATIAAQVEHVRFYLDVMQDYMQGKRPENVDWTEIWRTVEAVTPDAWEASQKRLRTSYEAVLALVDGDAVWESDDGFWGAVGVAIHTAYHLGEIRQALCTIKTR